MYYKRFLSAELWKPSKSTLSRRKLGSYVENESSNAQMTRCRISSSSATLNPHLMHYGFLQTRFANVICRDVNVCRSDTRKWFYKKGEPFGNLKKVNSKYSGFHAVVTIFPISDPSILTLQCDSTMNNNHFKGKSSKPISVW